VALDKAEIHHGIHRSKVQGFVSLPQRLLMASVETALMRIHHVWMRVAGRERHRPPEPSLRFAPAPLEHSQYGQRMVRDCGMPIQRCAANHQLLGDRQRLTRRRRANEAVDHVDNRRSETGRCPDRIQPHRVIEVLEGPRSVGWGMPLRQKHTSLIRHVCIGPAILLWRSHLLNDWRDETIPAFGNCLNESGTFQLIIQHLTQAAHCGIQSRLKIAEFPILPEPLSELLACHNLAGLLEERLQNKKRLLPQRQDNPLPG
jgi:hypothetical protein